MVGEALFLCSGVGRMIDSGANSATPHIYRGLVTNPTEPRKSPDTTPVDDVDHIGLIVMWQDGSLTCGRTAADLLRRECGGWNPSTLPAFRRALARRAGIPAPIKGESSRHFIERLVDAGILKLFDVDKHFPEFRPRRS